MDLSKLRTKTRRRRASRRGKDTKGISMIELIIVMGITATLVGLGGINYVKFRQKTNVDSDAGRIVAELRDVVIKAKAQQDGTSWGIKFVNTSTRDYYQVLKGGEGTSTKTIYLNSGVEFTNLYDPDDPGTATTTFSEMFLGGPTLNILDATGTIELGSTSGAGYTDTITISRVGLVNRISSY